MQPAGLRRSRPACSAGLGVGDRVVLREEWFRIDVFREPGVRIEMAEVRNSRSSRSSCAATGVDVGNPARLRALNIVR
eukprot:232633-Rhodomonas_salina.1